MTKCPDCFGDGIETCHNPDHGFLSAFMSRYGGNESACPGCGHSYDHKMGGVCYTCSGTGQVSKEEYELYLNENVPERDRDGVDEICLGDEE